MSAIGRLVGGLFGGRPRTSAFQAPPPPAPNTGDAGGEAAARVARSKAMRRKGLDDTILTGGLGNVRQSPSPRTSQPAPVKSLLG